MTKFGIVFVMLLVASTVGGSARVLWPEATRPVENGVAANQRLTALAGGTLFVLLAAIAVTIVFIQQLLPEHYLVGFILIPPLALKLASTGYRFGRYYTGSPSYRRAGPPPMLQRLVIAPVLVISTLAVFVTGLELWAFGLRFGNAWTNMHTLSAVVFVAAAGLHLLAHFRRSAAAVADEVKAPGSQEAFTRRSLVVGTLLLGGALAAASLFYATPFPAPLAGA